MANTVSFNLAQLASWDQARELVKKLNEKGIGSGVCPESVDPDTSGIYTELWLGGPGNFPEPHYVDSSGVNYYPLHLRFNNGAAGVNVGLVLDKLKRFPNSPLYVFGNLAAEVNSMATN